MATSSQTALPEDVLIATLHKVGDEVRLTDDQRLSDILDEAAKVNKDSPFVSFKAHPLYGYSRMLGETLQTLDHGGSIVRENAAQLYFKATAHTAGPFGQTVFDGFSPEQRAIIDEVADKIRRAFGAVDVPGESSAIGT